MDRKSFISYIKRKYDVEPDYPWRKYETNAVFRHRDNNKWFALVMNVRCDKLGITGDGTVDVVNLKVDDPIFRDMIIQQKGIMPAYHMNKLNWISVLLDGTVSDDQVCDLVDMSFVATASVRKKEKIRGPKEWIIPANPKFYDIIHAFDDAEEINWKQGKGIRVGDTVFMYVGAPVSAIMYRCKVTKTDIPYQYEDDNLTITALMHIKLLDRYDPDQFTFDRLKEEHGIYAVRGPRGIPHSLSEALKIVREE